MKKGPEVPHLDGQAKKLLGTCGVVGREGLNWCV